MDRNILDNFFSDNQPRADREKLESPLEELFIEKLEKYLSTEVKIQPQYEVQTIAGKFRLDFLLTLLDKKIAFECDGEEYHDEFRDEFRDGLILGTGSIDAIYRFRGKDLYTFLDDCIYLIYHFDQDLFNDRYEFIYPRLISDDLKEKVEKKDLDKSERTLVGHRAINKDGTQVGWLTLILERRDKNVRGHWSTLYEFALANPGNSIDKLIDLRKKEW